MWVRSQFCAFGLSQLCYPLNLLMWWGYLFVLALRVGMFVRPRYFETYFVLGSARWRGIPLAVWICASMAGLIWIRGVVWIWARRVRLIWARGMGLIEHAEWNWFGHAKQGWFEPEEYNPPRGPHVVVACSMAQICLCGEAIGVESAPRMLVSFSSGWFLAVSLGVQVSFFPYEKMMV